MPHRRSHASKSDERIRDWANNNTETAQEAVHGIARSRHKDVPSQLQLEALFRSKYGEEGIRAALPGASEAFKKEVARKEQLARAESKPVELKPSQRFERVQVPDRNGKFHPQERVRSTTTGRFEKIVRVEDA